MAKMTAQNILGDIHTYGGVGKALTEGMVLPVSSDDMREGERSFVYRFQRGPSVSLAPYKNIESAEFPEENRTFGARSLVPVAAEMPDLCSRERLLDYYWNTLMEYVGSISSAVESRRLIIVESAEQSPQFSPDFGTIRKWITFVIAGSYVGIEELAWMGQAKATFEFAPDVLLEIRKENLQNAINTAITIARETFKSLQGIEVGAAYDPEIPGRKTFRLMLTVSGNPIDVLCDERQFKKQLYPVLGETAREKITVTYNWVK
jgi:hypothetical protein